MTDGLGRLPGPGATPRRTTCIACLHPFDSNGELASIRDARRIAFDPGHQRVWRICSSCGTWNLLGPEASAAAMPELQARFGAAPRSRASEYFAPALIGSHLELIRLGERAPAGTDHFAALRRRRTIDRNSLIAAWAVGLLGLMFVAEALYLLPRGALFLSATHYLTSIPLYNLGEALQRWRHQVPIARRFVLLNAAVLIAGLAAAALGGLHELLVVFPFMAAAIAIWCWSVAPAAIFRVRMAYRSDMAFRSREEMTRVAMSWGAESGDIQLFDLPMGQDASGTDAVEIVHAIVQHRHLSPVRRRSATESAYKLLQAVGDLHGLLHALDGFRRDHGDRIALADLPPIYQVALDLALAKETPPVGMGDEFHRQAREAAAIAAEAEALDVTVHGDVSE